jgi:hypothetical protein
MSENFLVSFRNGEEIRLDAGQVLFKKGDARATELDQVRLELFRRSCRVW